MTYYNDGKAFSQADLSIWGEWYFTSRYGKDWSKNGAVATRNRIIDHLLDMTPGGHARCSNHLPPPHLSSLIN